MFRKEGFGTPTGNTKPCKLYDQQSDLQKLNPKSLSVKPSNPHSASQPLRPLVPQPPSAPQPPGSAPCLAQGQSSSPGLLYVLYTHILLCCYLGSIQNPKQCCFAVSNITTDKVLTSWMHEAFQ